MTDYKHLKITEPESAHDVALKTLASVGFILFMTFILFLKELLVCLAN